MSKQIRKILNISTVSDLEWLYVPDIEYMEIDGCKRFLQMIVPYKPDLRDEKFPVILFIPGSAWYKQEMYNKIPILGKLAEYGFGIVMVQIRESTIAPFPAQVQDAKTAVRFIRKNAESFHFDAENIFLAGDSSGAHTALLAGLTENLRKLDSDLYPEYSCCINGIIDICGPTNLLTLRDKKRTEEPTPSDDLLGGVFVHSVPELALKASCDTYIDKKKPVPPILMIHGTDDQIVSHDQSVQLYEKLKEHDKEVMLYSISGAGHGGHIYWHNEVLDIIADFIRSHMH